ncbi:hypothetical protein [Streptomyces sp. enrichment culture]|uniref:hypothetical protein n=1 Tax=Streptomyces sp. enrichment culture TaxID=1795815 RepID=UPI003F557E3F
MSAASRKAATVLTIALLAGLAFTVSAWTSYSIARVLIIEGVFLLIVSSLVWLVGRRRT